MNFYFVLDEQLSCISKLQIKKVLCMLTVNKIVEYINE